MKSYLATIFILLAIVLCINSFTFSNIRFPKKVQNNQPHTDQQCNITHFEYQNNVSLGKNDQLNKTFIKLGQKINALNNVTWKKTDSITFVIYQANPTFYYRDSKQKAEIVGNDSIVIGGGKAQVAINFKWSKLGPNPKYGQGSVLGLSDQIIFAKKIVIEGDFFRYDLLDYKNVTFTNSMNLTRISPADISAQDRADVFSLVNNIMNVTTLRHQLQNDIALYYAFYLKMNLHDESQPIDQYFEYKWTSPVASKGSLVIPFVRRPGFIDIQRDGIHYGYEARIKNYSNWRCGPMPPILPFNTRVYGGSQQFTSYSFFQNVARYAAEKGQLDTILSRDLWSTRMFQFYAGDLYEIFPKVAEQFVASTEVTGDCKANVTEIKVYKGGANTFNVSLHTVCQLNINRTKILDFNVGFQLQIEGVPQADYLDLQLESHTQFISYFQYNGWKMQNKQLADAMVSRAIGKLYHDKIFGSGWPLHPVRDYPHFQAEIDATFVYDSTHV